MTSRQDDSLNLYFERANNDSLPFKVRYDYTKKAEDIVLKRPNDSMNRVNMFKVANRYWNMDDLENYKKLINEILNDPKVYRDSLFLGKAYSYYGEYCEKKYFLDSAYLLYNKAENIYNKINNKKNLAKTLLSKSRIQFEEKDFTTSEKTVIEALEILRLDDDDYLRYSAYNLLGSIHTELNDFSKSLEFHNKALDIIDNNTLDNEDLLKSTSLNNIGTVYQNQEKHLLAIKYFEMALETCELIKVFPLGYVTILNNLGFSQLKVHNYQNLPDIFFESLKISDSLNFQNIIISSKLNLSHYYNVKEEKSTSITYARDAYRLAKKYKLPDKVLKSLKCLLEVNPESFENYTKEYFKINDSLQLAERQTRNKFARIEYETEELTLEKNDLIDQRKTILYISSCIFLILVLTLLFWYQKSKNRELVFIKEQQQANEEIYTLMLDQHQKLEEGKQFEKARIAKELHDGIMGRLSSIRLNLFVLEKKTDETTIAKCIEHIHEIQEVEKEIKSIAYDLGNNLFSENISFETMVRKLFTAIENHSDINFKLFIEPKLDWEMVGNNFKIQIYRILQEALQNIDKYANAKNVLVSIKKPDNAIEIEITDDGIGFEKKKVKKGFGLKNMKARAKEINGKVVVKSEKEKGTSVLLIVPSKP